jgi:hypothetical protein
MLKSTDVVRALAQLAHVDTLILEWPLGDVGLADLRLLRSLRTLHLKWGDLQDEHVNALAGLESLRHLLLDLCVNLTDACLPVLSTLKLDTLSLAWTRFSNVQCLQAKRLSVMGCRNMTAEGLKHGIGTRVEELDLSHCPVKGGALLLCCELRKLTLDQSQIGGLDLRQMSLRELDVACPFNFSNVAGLQASLQATAGPTCSVRVFVETLTRRDDFYS